MNEVIIVAGATHREGFIDEYEASLAKEDIPFHLEKIDLPGGACGITMQWRIDYFRKMAYQFLEYNTIFITDAWDVMFFGTKQELIDKAPSTFLCSAERNCYPEPHLAHLMQGGTPWKYSNNGMVVANPRYLIEWCDRAQQTPDMNILDQGWFNRRRAEQSELTPLDETTKLFYVVSSWLEDGSLQAKDGRPWNIPCNTYPNFLHFSGACSSDTVRKMLEESK